MGLVAVWHVASSQIRGEPMSPALAGRFFTAELPGKPCLFDTCKGFKNSFLVQMQLSLK